MCRRFGVRRLELFGSGARGEFVVGESDLDFLVEFESAAAGGGLEGGSEAWKGASGRYFGLLHGLEDLFGVRVDLVDRSAVTNPYFLPVAERDRELLYAA